MFLAALVLILSAAMFFFYFQTTCQKIVRRQFEQEYFRSIVTAHRLEFLALQASLEESGVPVGCPRLHRMLKCDFLALTYLLKNAANVSQRYSNEERLLILYSRWQFLSLAVRCLLGLDEKKAALKVTSVLQYFANVVGQRVNRARAGNIIATDYLSMTS
ncbi:MAG TPA: hypothetical protein VEO19_04020 [Terriglobia bacterium]|nr:hypothetical protein [Terriglobia bacterium]